MILTRLWLDYEHLFEKVRTQSNESEKSKIKILRDENKKVN